MAYKRKAIKRKRTKRPIKRRKTTKKTSFTKRVKQVVMKTSETKRVAVSWTKIELFHNVLSLTQMLKLNGDGVMPGPSTGQSGRIGDQISVLGWQVRMLWLPWSAIP